MLERLVLWLFKAVLTGFAVLAFPLVATVVIVQALFERVILGK